MYTPKNCNHLRSHLRAIMALDHSRLGLKNNFLENKSGRIFCVRQVYFTKSCQQIYGRVITNLLYILYITSEVKQYYETLLKVLSYRPRRECSISQFCNTDCTHSIFRTIEARVGFQLDRRSKKNFQNHLYGQPVLTFAVRAVVKCLNEHHEQSYAPT